MWNQFFNSNCSKWLQPFRCFFKTDHNLLFPYKKRTHTTSHTHSCLFFGESIHRTAWQPRETDSPESPGFPTTAASAETLAAGICTSWWKSQGIEGIPGEESWIPYGIYNQKWGVPCTSEASCMPNSLRNKEPCGFLLFLPCWLHSLTLFLPKSITSSQTKSLLISWKGQVLYLPLIFRKLIAAAAHAPAAKLGRVRCGGSRRCMRGREIQGGTS